MEDENRIISSIRPLQVQRSFEGSANNNHNTTTTTTTTDNDTTNTNDNDQSQNAAPSIRKREFYDVEIIHQTTVRIERPLKNIDVIKFAYFVLVVLLFSGLCLVTEGSVPLAYILPAVSFISVLSFCLLKL